jgi:hypothetical protein
MPKYTHEKLDVYLKQDAKKIKNRNSQLKLSNILNSLSTLFGYKNFNELKKRSSDKTTILLVSLKYSDLVSVLSKYRSFVENEIIKDDPKTGYFFYSKLEYLKSITKFIYETSTDSLLLDKYIDFTDTKNSLSFDNENFIKFIIFYIKSNSKNQVNKAACNISKEHFLLIVDVMKYFKVKNFQKEVLKWSELNLLTEMSCHINDSSLNLRLTAYFKSINNIDNPMDKYQNHQRIFNSLINLMFNPLFNINESKNVLEFEHMLNKFKNNKFKKYKKIVLLFNEDYHKKHWFEFLAIQH